MKRYKLKVDSPWGKKGDKYSHYVEYFIYKINESTGMPESFLKILHPKDYPEIFEEIQELSDAEWLREWLCQKDINSPELDSYITLAEALIVNGFDVKKLREKNENILDKRLG